MDAAEHGADIFLLGGVREGSHVKRDACLRELTGVLEERLHAIVRRIGSTPEKVSAVMEAVVESVAGRRMDAQLAGELCIADRRLLMLQIARRSAGDTFWINPACRYCRERFDVEVSRSELPTKPAGATFPFADVVVRGDPIRVRVPNGSDQVRIADLDEDAAKAALLRRCVTTMAGDPPEETFFQRLSDEDITAFETALDDVAPDLGTFMEVICPSCAKAQVVEFDPYQFGVIGDDSLYHEVHTLACTYHWNEADILSLSRERRHIYLRLVERSTGTYS